MSAFIPLPAHGRLLGHHRSASRPSTTADEAATPATARRRHHRRFLDPANLPEALPCRNFYERMPEKVGPTGNVVLTDPEELAAWLLVARPVSAKEAEEHGGCLVYTPSRAQKSKHAPAPQYYCITATDDEVYGRGVYYSLPQKLKQAPSVLLTGSFDSDTSRDGCSEDREDEMGVSTCSTKLPSRRGSSMLFERPSF